MRKRIWIAVLFLLVGVIYLTDWILFSIAKGNKNLSWVDFKERYVQHFPDFLKPFFQNAILSTVFFIFILSIAGLIFVGERKTLLKIPGILSIILAAWLLFSLM